jgi:GTP-binding protein
VITGKEVFSDTDRLFADYLGKFGGAAEMPPTTAEVAFIGRSNSGKSSLLKALLNCATMPQVSGKPGSTRLIHVYSVGSGAATIADFPGYGYAQSSKAFRARFSAMLLDYLTAARPVKALCLMMDARRGAGAEEKEIARIARERRVPLILCLNKADQLNQSEAAKLKQVYAGDKTFFEVVLLSAMKRQNLGYVRQFIASLF